MKKTLTLIALVTGFYSGALAANMPIPAQEFTNQNLLKNPGFENGSVNWTASGGATKTANTTAVGEGSKGYDWDSNSAAQTLLSDSITIPNGLKLKQGYAVCMVKVPSGTATHTMSVNDGTNDIISPITISSSSTSFQAQAVNFIFPSSGSVRLKFSAVAANEVELYIDSCYMGLASNIQNVSQAVLYGTVKVTGCSGPFQSSVDASTSYTNATGTTPTGCTYTVTGAASAPSSTIMGIKFATMPAGEYMIEYEGSIGPRGVAASSQSKIRFNDGTNSTREESAITALSSSADNMTPGIRQTFSYTSPASNVTWQVQDKTGGAAGDRTYFYGTTAAPSVIRVWRFPSVSDQSIRLDSINWKVDANISGANPSLGTADVSSYTGIENGSLTLTNNSGNGNITAQIPCSSTNSPSGTTCAAGNESVGVSFNASAGDVLACASFTHYTNVTGTNSATFQLVETPNNAQTISQEGKSRINTLSSPGSAGATAFPARVCGNFTFASAGQKTIRLVYEQDVTGTVTTSQLLGDASATEGQRDIHFEVYPLNYNMAAFPILDGMVTNSGTGRFNMEYVQMADAACTSTPCTLAYNTSGIASVTRSGTGSYLINFNSGVFSRAPVCTVMLSSVGSVALSGALSGNSSTAFSVTTLNSSFAASNSSFTALCFGPK